MSPAVAEQCELSPDRKAEEDIIWSAGLMGVGDEPWWPGNRCVFGLVSATYAGGSRTIVTTVLRWSLNPGRGVSHQIGVEGGPGRMPGALKHTYYL